VDVSWAAVMSVIRVRRNAVIMPTISKTWVDTGFKNAVIEHGANLGIDVEVVSRSPEIRGFHVVKRRWVVERSIGWISCADA
jgi:hypothetical protein